LIRIERSEERTQSVVVDRIEDGDEIGKILAEAVDMLAGSHDGHPTVTLCRLDGSTLSLSTDGRRALAVWINSLEESAHSVGGQPGPTLVFDYSGSYGEAPNEWTVPIADAVECARRFIQFGAPDTEEVLFEQD
jgi:hypothetical protein